LRKKINLRQQYTSAIVEYRQLEVVKRVMENSCYQKRNGGGPRGVRGEDIFVLQTYTENRESRRITCDAQQKVNRR